MFRIIFNNIFQFYQLFASDFNLQSAIRVLETMIPGLFVVYCYFSVYFDLLTVRINFFILLYLLYLVNKKKEIT